MQPFRIEMKSVCVQPLSVLSANAASCDGLEKIAQCKLHGRKLAIVGSGNSTMDFLDELRAWDGDIWAINSTGAWLRDHCIESTFFTVDPGAPELFNLTGMDDAIIATLCHPELKTKFKTVRLFDMIETDPNGVTGGVTTATRAPLLALRLGYGDISFFGCEGSFQDKTHSHITKSIDLKDLVIVLACGNEYLTDLEFLSQAENLAQIFNLAPDIFHNRSGGLLEAIQCNPDTWAIAAVDESLKAKLEAFNGASGLYDTIYRGSEW